jgi:UDP-N-acetylmuramate dehydrogenase
MPSFSGASQSLKTFNSFGIDVVANSYLAVHTEDQIPELLEQNKDIFLLGGGSNILFTESPKQLLVHIQTKGKDIINETESYVDIEVQAGENWHDFVMWCIENNYGGLENLALIPGCVGASPMQNIGAYGVEVKDSIQKVNFYDIASITKNSLSNKACNFAYRYSIFKGELKNQIIISSVVFRLTKSTHKINRDYGVINQRLLELGTNNNPGIRDIANAVISIREEKLPNPKIIGNAGSFFKNPVIEKEQYEELIQQYPDMPSYKMGDKFKIPAAWLIDQCGLKGFEKDGAAVHVGQPLVIINKGGNATGDAILNLAKLVQSKVSNMFGVTLDMEVNIYKG